MTNGKRGTYQTESKGDSSIKSYPPKLFYLGRDEGLIWKIKKYNYWLYRPGARGGGVNLARKLKNLFLVTIHVYRLENRKM